MGLTTWKKAPDGRVQRSDTIVAKNYLSEKEIQKLNRLSTAVLDFAEYDKFKLVQDRDYLSDFDKEIKRLYEKK